MDPKVTKILDELYHIDPNFKKHEKQLRTIVMDLITSKPDTQFDTKFAMKLREDLMRAAAKSVVSPYAAPVAHFSFYSLRYSLVGSLVTLLLVAPLTYYGTKSTANKNISTGFTLEQQIASRGSNAFGSLGIVGSNVKPKAISDVGGDPMMAAPTEIAKSAPSPMGMSIASSPAIAPDAAISGGMGGGMSTKMAFPISITKYVYTGEPLASSTGEGVVYKRIKNADSTTQLATVLSNANFGLLNLNSFSNLKTRNIEIVEDKNEGYSININFDEGVIAINQNWQKWNNESTEPLAISKRPTDETLISIANTFLAERGINRSLYGTPVVQDQQAIMYAQGAPETTIYAPEIVNVVYPQMIDGVEVYDEGGSPYGLNVSVSVRLNKVAGVYNISSQVYESANYALETDSKIILDRATFSGMSEIYYPTTRKPDVKTVELQTPKRVLMRHMSYDGKGEGSELYVPALLFPIKGGPTPYTPQNTIVPLVKTVLDEGNKVDPVPMSKPLI